MNITFQGRSEPQVLRDPRGLFLTRFDVKIQLLLSPDCVCVGVNWRQPSCLLDGLTLSPQLISSSDGHICPRQSPAHEYTHMQTHICDFMIKSFSAEIQNIRLHAKKKVFIYFITYLFYEWPPLSNVKHLFLIRATEGVFTSTVWMGSEC